MSVSLFCFSFLLLLRESAEVEKTKTKNPKTKKHTNNRKLVYNVKKPKKAIDPRL